MLKEGDGTKHPKPDTPCDCHYKGNVIADVDTLGKQFDSSYDRGEPSSFAPSQVIAGWTEAMQLMVEGDKWEMYIPSNLGYGDSGDVSGTLVFTMELVKINGDGVPSTRPPKAKPKKEKKAKKTKAKDDDAPKKKKTKKKAADDGAAPKKAKKAKAADGEKTEKKKKASKKKKDL